MVLEKTITANGSHGKHKFTLSVKESNINTRSSFLDYVFKLSPIQNGWNWSGWGSNISYEIVFKYRQHGDEEDTILKYKGTIPSYNGSSTVNLKTGSNIEIPHDSDGTRTINISFEVTDNANGKSSSGQYYTPGNASASDTFTLSVLHTPPTINSISVTENNSTLVNYGVANNVIVQYLSRKTFTISALFYDNASISNVSVYHNNVLIGTSSSSSVTINFNNVGELLTTENIVGLMIQVTDSLGGKTSQMFNYSVIKYIKPTIEQTSTSIKRKTGSGTVLTDNKANLNFVGVAYKQNNVIGNHNTPVVEYKIWNTSEPSSYTSVTATISENNVTISNYVINNVIYTNTYNYKIRIRDTFGNSNEKGGRISTGTSVWTEYKDRVDFVKLQQNGKNILTTDYIKTLWQNSSMSTFASQTVTLNESINNFNYYEVIYKINDEQDFYVSSGKTPVGLYNSTVSQDGFKFVYRYITAMQGTSVSFGDCRQVNSYGSGTTVKNNSLIPYQIIGYK